MVAAKAKTIGVAPEHEKVVLGFGFFRCKSHEGAESPAIAHLEHRARESRRRRRRPIGCARLLV